MLPAILVTGNIPSEWLAGLNDLAQVTVWSGREHLMPRKDLLGVIQHYNGLINFAEVKADENFILRAGNLCIIANCSIGYDNLNLPFLTAKKIWATNAPGFFNYPVAEYVLAGMLAISRRLLEADDFVRKRKWSAFEPGKWDGVSLKDKIIGIVGLGTIGKVLRLMLTDLGARVIYYTPVPKQEEGWRSFEELITTSDIISIHVPLTSQTVNLFDNETISKIKKGSIVVNTSRGAVIDQDALIRALLSGMVGGAVMDVFEDEPNVPAELLQMKNVFLTPHIAGGTRQAREACVKRAVQNVSAVLKNEKPPNALNELLP